MPSDQSTWLISVPETGDVDGLFHELSTKLCSNSKSVLPSNLSPLTIPSFKAGTLDSLITLSEELPKHDAFFTATVAKTVDTLRNLLNNDPSKLAQHILVNEQPVDAYLLRGWTWNEGRYGVQRALRDMVDALSKAREAQQLQPREGLPRPDAAQEDVRTFLLSSNAHVLTFQMPLHLRRGNLSVRSLADIVHKEQFIQDSEYLQTLLVAVPKNLVKDWNAKYERLTPMIVPRSSTVIASDNDYTLFGVVVFKRVHDDFLQKCRDNKFIVRDFVYSEDILEKQREELETADTTEKDLWARPLCHSHVPAKLTPISADGAATPRAHQLLRVLPDPRAPQGPPPIRRERPALRPPRALHRFLHQGLPLLLSHAPKLTSPSQPEPKATKRTLAALQTQFAYLAARANPAQAKDKPGGGGADEFVGEYQTLLEQEYFDFVLFEVPWIIF
ncbi:V-type proton ATPase subunit C 1 [Grifola frondosa]|uniref:V-type proton ATPase subunit C n=1 Tax=Grifola frondosa TaxID=5627 RepID=A0A1C7MPM3_GRIFR|nr:V-type proton ATPase subunit C 1 [Grifola frondosa]